MDTSPVLLMGHCVHCGHNDLWSKFNHRRSKKSSGGVWCPKCGMGYCGMGEAPDGIEGYSVANPNAAKET